MTVGGGVGGGEGREVMSRLCRAWWATGRTWAFTLSEVGPLEGWELSRDVP